MQTQQVHGVTGSLLYTVKSASVKSSESSFDQLMQIQNTEVVSQTEKQPVAATKESSAEHVGQPKEVEQAVESTGTEETVKAEKEMISDQKTENAESTEESADVSDAETAEKMTGLLKQITDVIRDILKLSEEELEHFMEQLGITAADLVSPEQLQNLVLFVNNEQDAVSLITDAKLLTTVKELTSQVQQLLQDAGVTAEELSQYMTSPEFDAMVDEAVEQLNEKVQAEEEELTTVQKQEVLTENQKVAEKSTTVEFQTAVKQEAEHESAQDKDTSAENDAFATQFTQNLQKAAENISDISGDKDLVQTIREIADQILEKVKVTVTAETTSLEIVLTPEELGKVNLTVSEQDGVLKARFVTENELAKEAIESNLVQFKEMLNEQGLKVDSIEVAVGNFEFDKNGQTGQSNAQEEKRNGKHQFMNDDSIGQAEETDQLARHFMEGGESTVNYMA